MDAEGASFALVYTHREESGLVVCSDGVGGEVSLTTELRMIALRRLALTRGIPNC